MWETTVHIAGSIGKNLFNDKRAGDYGIGLNKKNKVFGINQFKLLNDKIDSRTVSLKLTNIFGKK